MNIYDIAQEAGVSIATVSRVLNHKGAVGAATREKVEAVLARHNYAPSAIARGMAGKPLRTVAVLTVDIRVPHYARTAYTMEQEFSRRGYEVILCNTGGDGGAALRYLNAVTRKQVDGMVLVGSVFNRIGREPEVEAILKKVPVVLANGALDLPGSRSVLVDDAAGIRAAAEHLLARGRKDIVYIKDLDTASADAKRDGFLSVLEGGRIIEAENGVDAARQLLSSGQRFDAVVCGEDLTAAQVVNELCRAGLRVPEDVAVTGYNCSVYSTLSRPSLTSVDNKPEEVAARCVELLENLMEGNEEVTSVSITPELVPGESTCGDAPAGNAWAARPPAGA